MQPAESLLDRRNKRCAWFVRPGITPSPIRRWDSACSITWRWPLRVLIVDWDVHHGNGTQDQTWTDPQIGFFSVHRWPFYPGTGRADETGTGDALGTKLNLPLEFGTSRARYFDRFRLSLETIAARIKPELVLISAGFDAHTDDPIGSLGLETEDFAKLTDAVLDVAEEFAGGRVVSVLEGGYNTGILAGCVETHLRHLLARERAK
jgi:acetoin utilization deacetylase AcuC-like enzyme